MNRSVAVTCLAALLVSGCQAQGTDPDFPMYVQCVEASK